MCVGSSVAVGGVDIFLRIYSIFFPGGKNTDIYIELFDSQNIRSLYSFIVKASPVECHAGL